MPASRAAVTRFFSEWPVSMMIGTNGLALAPGCRIICVELEPVEDRHRPVGDHDVGHVVGEGLEAGRAVLGLIDFARAEAMQQRAHDAPHMGVVVDDEEAQAVEIDADHGATEGPGTRPQDLAIADGRFSLLRKG